MPRLRGPKRIGVHTPKADRLPPIMVESDLAEVIGLLGFERELLLPHVRGLVEDLFRGEDNEEETEARALR